MFIRQKEKILSRPHACKTWVKDVLIYCLIGVVLFFCLSPIFWMAITSIKYRVEAWTLPPKLIFHPTLDNFKIIFIEKKFGPLLINTMVVALLSAGISMFIGVPGAYALARFKLRGKESISFWILTTRMAPPVIAAMPLYLIMRSVSLLDTRTSLIVVYSAFNLAFVIWIMKSFFEEVPRELEESALLDGCSNLGVIWRITLPLSLGGLVTAYVFCLIMSWNEFLFAMVLTSTNAKTLPVGIAALLGAKRGIWWGQMMAGGVITTTPVFAIAFFIQKYLIRGLTFGAIKG